MVKCKYFADANITNILNIREFFAIFFKKKSPSPPHSLIFAIKAMGSKQVNESTSQRVEVRQVRQVRQEMGLMGLMGPMGPMGPIGPMGPKTKHSHQPPPARPRTPFIVFSTFNL